MRWYPECDSYTNLGVLILFGVDCCFGPHGFSKGKGSEG